MKTETTLDKIKRWLWLQFDGFITMPSVRDLPSDLMYLVGFLAIVGYITVFVTFTTTGYYTSINTNYLVPLTGPDGTCTTINRPLPSNVYIADENGAYLGQSVFVYSKAIYSLNFNNLRVNNELYSSVFSSSIKPVIESVGKVSEHNDLSRNILLWLAWKIVIPDPSNNLQEMYFVADPGSVFGSLTSSKIS